jgi:hypothetical protein
MGMFAKARKAVRRYRSFDPVRSYLAESVSLADLERRQREIDDDRFRRQRGWPF